MRVQRPTVSFLVRLDDPYKVLLVKFRPPKRDGKIGIPGGGREMTDTVISTAFKEGEEELGLGCFLTQDKNDWLTLSIRDNPDRDDVYGNRLSKYVDGEDVPDITVDARHNLDILLVFLPLFMQDPVKLVPSDLDEIEEVRIVDVRTLPDQTMLCISDDFKALQLYREWVSGTPIVTPVYL